MYGFLCVVYVFFKIGGIWGQTQEPMVTVRQGVIVGVQIYPENYPGAIHAYMGIPYAAAPVGLRRFSPPERHPGWNKTLFAGNIPPNCPHNILSKDTQSEDCLFLNIWTPIVSERYNKVPVLIFFDGVDFAHVNPLHPIPGQDLAAEGLVVVTANYRLNVFGFLCLGNGESRGNMGLLDQYMVLLWINDNIEKFGGDRRSITLMGYSSGATSVLYHLTSRRTKDLFSQAIVMSPSIPLKTNHYVDVVNNSLGIAEKLGCYTQDLHVTLQCLRNISTQDLLNAFDSKLRSSPLSPVLHPVVDSFLPPNDQYLSYDLLNAVRTAKFWNMPVLIGLNSLEAFKESWLELMNKSYDHLYNAVYSDLPNIFQAHLDKNIPSNENLELLLELIKWKYLKSRGNGNSAELLKETRRLYSDVLFDGPIFQIVEFMKAASQPIFVYRFIYSSTLDLKPGGFNVSGATHGNDLPFLFGPTLFQQITRRRGSQIEKNLMKQMKSLWANFIKIGNPLPGRSYDLWRPFNDQQYIQAIGDINSPTLLSDKNTPQYLDEISFWSEFLPKVGNIRSKGDNIAKSYQNSDASNIYKQATYTLTGLITVLLILLFICIVLMKQRAKERQRHSEF